MRHRATATLFVTALWRSQQDVAPWDPFLQAELHFKAAGSEDWAPLLLFLGGLCLVVFAVRPQRCPAHCTLHCLTSAVRPSLPRTPLQTLVYTCLQHQSSQEAATAAERIVRYRQAVQRRGLYTTPSPGHGPAQPPGLYDVATHTARGLPVYGTMGFEPGKVYCATVSPHAFEVTLGASAAGAASAGGGTGDVSGGRRAATAAAGRRGAEDGRDLPPVRTDGTLPKLVISVDKSGQSTGVPAYGRMDPSTLVPSASLQTGSTRRREENSGGGVGPADVVVEVRAPSKFRWKPPQALPAGAPWVPGPGDGRGEGGRIGGGDRGIGRSAAPRASAAPVGRLEKRDGDVERGSRPAEQSGPPARSPGISSAHAAAQRKDARAWRGDVNNKL
jgi:hypothetical protein